MEYQKFFFAPGCELAKYKPHLAAKLHDFLDAKLGTMERLSTCCKGGPAVEPGTCVVSVCPGCHRRYKEEHEGSGTVSVWEVIAESDDFDFPDYGGATMSVNDACPVRNSPEVHDAIRALLKKMNIRLVEPERTRTESLCCGDSYRGQLANAEVRAKMCERAAQMPADEVATYCTSCTRSMSIGGKRPRYVVDLLFGESTTPGTLPLD